jgi:hypothetical protein
MKQQIKNGYTRIVDNKSALINAIIKKRHLNCHHVFIHY